MARYSQLRVPSLREPSSSASRPCDRECLSSTIRCRLSPKPAPFRLGLVWTSENFENDSSMSIGTNRTRKICEITLNSDLTQLRFELYSVPQNFIPAFEPALCQPTKMRNLALFKSNLDSALRIPQKLPRTKSADHLKLQLHPGKSLALPPPIFTHKPLLTVHTTSCDAFVRLRRSRYVAEFRTLSPSCDAKFRCTHPVSQNIKNPKIRAAQPNLPTRRTVQNSEILNSESQNLPFNLRDLGLKALGGVVNVPGRRAIFCVLTPVLTIDFPVLGLPRALRASPGRPAYVPGVISAIPALTDFRFRDKSCSDQPNIPGPVVISCCSTNSNTTPSTPPLRFPVPRLQNLHSRVHHLPSPLANPFKTSGRSDLPPPKSPSGYPALSYNAPEGSALIPRPTCSDCLSLSGDSPARASRLWQGGLSASNRRSSLSPPSYATASGRRGSGSGRFDRRFPYTPGPSSRYLWPDIAANMTGTFGPEREQDHHYDLLAHHASSAARQKYGVDQSPAPSRDGVSRGEVTLIINETLRARQGDDDARFKQAIASTFAVLAAVYFPPPPPQPLPRPPLTATCASYIPQGQAKELDTHLVTLVILPLSGLQRDFHEKHNVKIALFDPRNSNPTTAVQIMYASIETAIMDAFLQGKVSFCLFQTKQQIKPQPYVFFDVPYRPSLEEINSTAVLLTGRNCLDDFSN
ncbi:hypothetical protein FB451DRAFT_1195743 [Mycena latifolia]|nr:hypothetical protein FB451DRAFT_1195743 [Mycena latifolia]